MKFTEETRKKIHEELDKQLEVLESQPKGGEMCIFDLELVVYEDDRSRVQDPNLVDNVVSHTTTEFVLFNDGSFDVEDRAIRVGRCGDIEEFDGEWRQVS